MSTAKKFELAPDEVYIQETLKDGRARLVNDLSMKELGTPDVAFQARIKHLDMDHVHRLSLIHDQEGRLSPIVAFRSVVSPNVWRLIMADGFHRHEVYRRKKLAAIRAYVIDVPMDRIEHEARLFAAMCNQQLSLGRTPQDIRKAVEILFTDPECWKWSDRRIANHCGAGPTTVTRYRAAFNIANKVVLPEMTIGRDGRSMRYEKTPGKVSVKQPRDEKKRFRLFDKKSGKDLTFANKEDAETKAKAITDELISRRNQVNPNHLPLFFARIGLSFTSIIGSGRRDFPGIRGYRGHGIIFTYTRFDEGDTVAWAYGCLHGLRKLADQPDARLVCLCVPEDAPAAILDLYRSLGIEFLTRDELVESLKPTPSTEK